MRFRYIPRERELKIFDDAGEEQYAHYGVSELRFGAGTYYIEDIPDDKADETDNDTQLVLFEDEFYALAAAPENPENTYQLKEALAKFKGLTPVALRAGRDMIDGHTEIRRKWLNDLKALEKSIAKTVKQAIQANGDEACQWRGTTGK